MEIAGFGPTFALDPANSCSPLCKNSSIGLPSNSDSRFSHFSDRQRNDKLGPGAFGALYGDTSSVRLNYRFDEAQPQAETTLCPALVPTIQPVPDPRLFAGRDPNTVILERHSDLFGRRVAVDGNVTAFLRVFDGIIEKVRKGLLDAVRIDIGKTGTVQPSADFDLLFLCDHSVDLNHVLQQLRNRSATAMQMHHAVLGFCDIHECV